MIKLTDEKIGTREFAGLILIAIGMKITDATPGLLYEKADNAAWILPILYLITIGLPFALLLSLLKKYQKGLVDLLFLLTGKGFGGIICFILFLITFLNLITTSRDYVAITNTLFYPKTSLAALTFLLLFTSYFVANRGLKAIANGSWLMIPILEITLTLLLFLTWKEVSWLRMFPLAGPGFGTLLKESVNYSFFVGEIIVLAAFFPFVKSYQNYQFASLLGFGIAIFKMILFLALYVMVFDYPSTVLMRYPHQELTRMAEFGPSLNHLEGGFFLFWLIAAIFRFAIYLYLAAFFLSKLLGLDQFKKLLLPLTGLIAFSSLLPANTFTLAHYQTILLKVSSWTLIALPFILWLLSKWKGEKQNEKAENDCH